MKVFAVQLEGLQCFMKWSVVYQKANTRINAL